MTKRILTAAAAAALIVPALAFAQVEVVNGEKGMVFKDTPSSITRDQVRAELESGKTLGDARWLYVGGEAGWTVVEPKYTFDRGQLVHASDCPFVVSLNAPKPKAGSSDLGYTGA